MARTGYGLLAVSALLVSVVSPPVLATDKYVATTGKDSNPGTQSSPFATLTKAVASLVAGDTLWIFPGTYPITSSVSLWNKSGTAGKPITISGILGKPRPIIDASAITSTTSGQNNGLAIGGGAEFITIRHVAISGAKGHGIALWYAKDIQILDCEVGNSQWNAIFGGTADKALQRIRVAGCWIHDNNRVNLGGASTSWGQGVGLAGAEQSVVEGNLVERTSGEGIDIYGGAKQCRVTANTVLDSFSVSIYLDHAQGTVIERNFLRTLDPAYFRGGSPSSGIQIADETGSGPITTANQDNIVRNNVAIGTSVAFSYGNYGLGAGLHGCQVLHNTFVGSLTSVIVENATAAGSSHQNNIFVGNAFVSPSKGQSYIPGGLTGLDFHQNAWFGGKPVAGQGDVTADPQLILPTSSSPFDLRPKAGSPLINSMTAVTPVAPDFLAQERPQQASSDMGAFETVDSSATVLSLPLPTGVTDPSRVFTSWNWGDGSEILSSIGITSSHHFGPGSHTVTATVHDPVGGTDTVNTIIIDGEVQDAGVTLGDAQDAGVTLGDAQDAGLSTAPQGTPDSSGCGCQVGSRDRSLGAVWLLVAGVVIARKRRILAISR